MFPIKYDVINALFFQINSDIPLKEIADLYEMYISFPEDKKKEITQEEKEKLKSVNAGLDPSFFYGFIKDLESIASSITISLSDIRDDNLILVLGFYHINRELPNKNHIESRKEYKYVTGNEDGEDYDVPDNISKSSEEQETSMF